MDGWGTEVKGERREGWEKSGKVTLAFYSSLTQANRTDRGEKELRNSIIETFIYIMYKQETTR